MTGGTSLVLASPAIAGILQRESQGSRLSKAERDQLTVARAGLARAMFAQGASLRDVIKGCGIRQQVLVQASGLAQSRVSRILARPTDDWEAQGARREGPAATLRLYRVAAKVLGVQLEEIPEAKQLLAERRRPD